MGILFRSVARLLFGKLLPRAAYPVLTGPLRGARILLGSMAGEGGGASVYFNMMEPEKTAALVEALRPGAVFFDVGANIGFYSIVASRILGPAGKVVAFEPSVTNLAYLHRHVELNRATNVLIVPAACADRQSLELFDAGRNRAEGHIAESVGSASTGPYALAPTTTVDAAVGKLGMEPDVLKIDVEGAEVSVLRGAQSMLRRKRPVIFLEVHSDTLRSACLEILQPLGYSFQTLSRDEATTVEDLVATPERVLR